MYILDRVENGIAVIEAEDEILNIPVESLPENAKEGDILVQNGENLEVDYIATQARFEAMQKRLNNLFEK